jgi:hypothetical protein
MSLGRTNSFRGTKPKAPQGSHLSRDRRRIQTSDLAARTLPGIFGDRGQKLEEITCLTVRAKFVCNSLRTSYVVLEWLPISALRRSHRQYLADHICKPNGHRQAIVKIAGVIIDLSEPHDVIQNCRHRRHSILAS